MYQPGKEQEKNHQKQKKNFLPHCSKPLISHKPPPCGRRGHRLERREGRDVVRGRRSLVQRKKLLRIQGRMLVFFVFLNVFNGTCFNYNTIIIQTCFSVGWICFCVLFRWILMCMFLCWMFWLDRCWSSETIEACSLIFLFKILKLKWKQNDHTTSIGFDMFSGGFSSQVQHLHGSEEGGRLSSVFSAMCKGAVVPAEFHQRQSFFPDCHPMEHFWVENPYTNGKKERFLLYMRFFTKHFQWVIFFMNY